MNQLRPLILISCLLFIFNCKTTPPLQFQENKQEQPALIVVGSKSSAINTKNVDINEEQTAYINMNEKTFINLLNANFDQLSLIEGIWSNEKNTYKIGIQKAKGKDKYFAFILNSQEPTMKKGEIIAEFFYSRLGRIYPTEYYLEDKTKIVTKSYIDEHGMLLIFLHEMEKESVAFFRNFPIREAKEKVKESLKENTRSRKELSLLKEKDDTQKIKQNSDVIEASSDKDYMNIVQARSDKKFENSNKLINKLKVDSQYASKTIYTIQTGSFLKVERAQKQFDSMLQILNGKEFSFLRIEKIGKYYSVRLGRFDNYNNTEKFIKVIKPQLTSAVILKAYIKNARLVRLYE